MYMYWKYMKTLGRGNDLSALIGSMQRHHGLCKQRDLSRSNNSERAARPTSQNDARGAAPGHQLYIQWLKAINQIGRPFFVAVFKRQQEMASGINHQTAYVNI